MIRIELDDRKIEVRFPAALEKFSFTESRPALGPTQPAHCVLDNRLMPREYIDRCVKITNSSNEDMNEWMYTSIPHACFWPKHRVKFTLILDFCIFKFKAPVVFLSFKFITNSCT
jgi:hypothetical protein